MAPDIAALNKPLGKACSFLGADCRCTIYESRPNVCRSYEPDELCEHIAAATLRERTDLYLAFFGLTAEAAEVERSGLTTMVEARNRVAASSASTASASSAHRDATSPMATPTPGRPQRIFVRRLPLVP